MRDKGVIVRDLSDWSQNHNFIPDDLSNYKVVRNGQFAINKMKAWQGSYGVSDCDGIVSPAYHVYTIVGVESDYFHHAIRSRAYVPYFSAASDGVRVGQWDLSAARMREIPFLVPSRSEQGQIVRYLDHADRRIRRYIRAKERMIELLEEQKQAIIHQAVTGQIDVRTGQPYPAYKDSGVEWLGEVPEHWEVRKLGQMGRFSKGSGGNKADESEDGVPCVRYGDLYTYHSFFIAASRGRVSAEVAASSYTPIHYGDVLFAGSGETLDEIGKSAVNLVAGSAYCGGDVIIFRPTVNVNAKLLGYAADSRTAVHQKARFGRGITVMHIYSSELKYMAVTLPTLGEQAAIASFLDHAIGTTNQLVAKASRQIELAVQYRTRLIADVVTGKLDVREIAGSLPDFDPLAAKDAPKGATEFDAQPQPPRP